MELGVTQQWNEGGEVGRGVKIQAIPSQRLIMKRKTTRGKWPVEVTRQNEGFYFINIFKYKGGGKTHGEVNQFMGREGLN